MANKERRLTPALAQRIGKEVIRLARRINDLGHESILAEDTARDNAFDAVLMAFPEIDELVNRKARTPRP